MYTVFNISDWFLQEVPNITNKKIQKLVYYAYAWHLVFNNETIEDLSVRLFPNEFQAWVHGIVTPSLYFKYKKYGSGILPVNGIQLVTFSEDELDVLKQVKDVYGKYNGDELEYINHQESPWLNARRGLSPYAASENAISDIDIFNCYSSRLQ